MKDLKCCKQQTHEQLRATVATASGSARPQKYQHLESRTVGQTTGMKVRRPSGGK